MESYRKPTFLVPSSNNKTKKKITRQPEKYSKEDMVIIAPMNADLSGWTKCNHYDRIPQ